ncbi:MAG: dihydroxyacetone kinase subunit L [Clostridiales bacterium]|jgi:dihydroxyacetone kinase-like protein|nr:dihydroxyacetone kinase subunit L [Clostridiales bacterium]
MNAGDIKRGFKAIAEAMDLNYDLLTRLDSEAGDGDLGVSMKRGFSAVSEAAGRNDSPDVGRLLASAAATLNEASPSTLGTIISTGLLACGKALRGKTEVEPPEAAEALATGLDAIMKRSGAKPGEKTILDSLIPAQRALASAAREGLNGADALRLASEAASAGCEHTKGMKAVHGRAAYYTEASVGRQDGGATVGKIIFSCLIPMV